MVPATCTMNTTATAAKSAASYRRSIRVAVAALGAVMFLGAVGGLWAWHVSQRSARGRGTASVQLLTAARMSLRQPEAQGCPSLEAVVLSGMDGLVVDSLAWTGAIFNSPLNPGELQTRHGVQTAAACALLCQEWNVCHVWTWRPTNTCTLIQRHTEIRSNGKTKPQALSSLPATAAVILDPAAGISGVALKQRGAILSPMVFYPHRTCDKGLSGSSLAAVRPFCHSQHVHVKVITEDAVR